MGEVKHRDSGFALGAENVVAAPQPSQTAQERRLAALRAAQGLWKDRVDIPKDGVEYQEQMRGEWV